MNFTVCRAKNIQPKTLNAIGEMLETAYRVFEENKMFKFDEWKLITNENLNQLTPREEKVVKMLYGLGGQDFHSFKEIADHFQLSIERVLQILNKAERKIRYRWQKDK